MSTSLSSLAIAFMVIILFILLILLFNIIITKLSKAQGETELDSEISFFGFRLKIKSMHKNNKDSEDDNSDNSE